MSVDVMKKPLFLQRWRQWNENPTDELLRLMIQEHLRPIFKLIAGKSYWLTHEEHEEIVAAAEARALKALPRFDPSRDPFHYFSRIGYNERNRMQEVVDRDNSRCYSYDDPRFDDCLDSSARLDGFHSFNPRDNEEPHFVFNDLVAISPLHKKVLTAMLEGTGVYGEKQIRFKELASELNLPENIIRAVVTECRGYLQGTTAKASDMIYDDELLLHPDRCNKSSVSG